MKRVLFIVGLIFLVSFYTGCTFASNDSDSTQDSQEQKLVASSSKERVVPSIENEAEYKKVITGNTKFALDLYHQIADDNENIFFSPYSISSLMAMLYAGAEGGTGSEIGEAMYFEDINGSLHLAFNYLDYRLNLWDDNLEVQSSNALWIQKENLFLEGYLDTLMENYGAGITRVDFINNAEGATEEINSWVSEKTKGKITEVVQPGEIDSTTRMILSNAIYFKAYWLSPFDENLTTQESFFLEDGSTDEVDMMHQETHYSHYRGENYDAVRLSYDTYSGYGMYIVLPDSDLATFEENSLTYDLIDEFCENSELKLVNLSLPKFSFEVEYNLTPYLNSMGVYEAFSLAQADFSGINGKRDLFISGLKHKAIITANEKGTEAAAVTITEWITSTNTEYENVELNIDRPFLFFIIGRDNDILFMGRVVNPNQ